MNNYEQNDTNIRYDDNVGHMDLSHIIVLMDELSTIADMATSYSKKAMNMLKSKSDKYLEDKDVVNIKILSMITERFNVVLSNAINDYSKFIENCKNYIYDKNVFNNAKNSENLLIEYSKNLLEYLEEVN